MGEHKIHPRTSYSFNQERLEQLKRLLPEAFFDDQIRWDVLQDVLSQPSDDETQSEYFGLNWSGKQKARQLLSRPSKGTLIPVKGAGMREDTTRNIFIEADNLEALKLLQKSYAGRVKMIYIDPPYNTGNDFIYNDDFTDSLTDYLQQTGQMDEDKQMLVANPKTNGRFHSRWLSMMYPRLILARTLLREDGVIFVSIDDNEVHHLRMLMDEVFGEENFIAEIAVRTNPRGRSLNQFIAKTHEYILIFSMSNYGIYEIPKTKKQLLEYKFDDAEGVFRLLELRNRNPLFNRLNRPNLYYPFFVDPDDNTVSLVKTDLHSIGPIYPHNSKGEDGCWTWGVKKANDKIKYLVAKLVNTGVWRIYRKNYLKPTTKPKSIWLGNKYNHEIGKEQLGRIFDMNPFDFPKSVDLLKVCMSIATTKSDNHIILDFFAGSGTTAQAVLELNEENGGGNRQFILVQLPETTSEKSIARKLGYKNISEITQERIRRVINNLSSDRLPIDNRQSDLGFKVFRYAPSHYREWETVETEEAYMEQLELWAESSLKDGWLTENVIYEVALLEGYTLNMTIEQVHHIHDVAVYRVYDELLDQSFHICLDETVPDDLLDRLGIKPTDLFICLDSALDDTRAANFALYSRLKTL